jgi:hypothetical protein
VPSASSPSHQAAPAGTDPADPGRPGRGYKWVALSNTTLGVLMATINSSIMLIALPDIFRGIGVNPLRPWPRCCAAAGTCTRNTARPRREPVSR